MHKGQLKNWIDGKGFGFIESSEFNQDIFIHISALRTMSRKPKIGDFIYFEVEKQGNGKSRAINCRIEGVAAKAIPKHKQRHKPRIHRNTSAPKNKFVLLFLIIGIGAFSYQRLGLSPTRAPIEQTPNVTINTAVPSEPLSNRDISDINANVKTDTKSQFSCDGRQHCSQMKSRAEAVYFINHCPNTKMDGDNDGIPCERDKRF